MTPQPQNKAQYLPDHFAWIDGLRGIAALAVVIFHYHHFFLADWNARGSLPPTENFPWAGILNPIFGHGASAVQLFWVISGFVFGHVYFNRPTTLASFAIARIARLYPLHLATLLFVAGLQLASLQWIGHWQIYGNNDLRHFGLQLLMSSNWSTVSRGLSFNGPIWSVSLEMLAYSLFFLALPVLRSQGLLAAMILAVVMWGLGLGLNLDIPLIAQAAFLCAGYFFLGNCTYLIMRRAGSRREPTLVLIAASLVSLGVGYVFTLSNLMLAGASVAVVALTALVDVKWKRPTLAWLKRLGDMSYSIYLIHVPLQMVVLLLADGVFDGSRSFATSPWTLPIYLLATIGLADITYRHFELPASRFLRRALSSQKQAST